MTKADLLKSIDATAGAMLCSLLRPFYVQKAVPSEIDHPQRVLVIRPGGMGDMILLFPVLRALKRCYPSAAIDLICETRNLDVVQLSGIGVEALCYDSAPFRILGRIRSRPYDLVIDAEQFHHFSGILGALSSAPVRVGFSINPRRNPLYTHLTPYSMTGYEADEFTRLLNTIGLDLIDADHQPLALPDCDIRFPDPVGDGKRIVLCAGSLSRYKRWPPMHYATLAKQLIHKGHVVILAGGKDDRSAAAEVTHLVNRPEIHDLTAELSLPEVAVLLGSSALFISGDTGLAHLARAAGTPCVSLFGPTDERKWARMDDSNRVVRNPVACAPCAMFGYYKPCRTIDCMQGITVESVFTNCLKLLK